VFFSRYKLLLPPDRLIRFCIKPLVVVEINCELRTVKGDIADPTDPPLRARSGAVVLLDVVSWLNAHPVMVVHGMALDMVVNRDEFAP
jgi:hypothetical protein